MFAAWTLNRMLILFTALAFAMVGTQVILFHYRGNFRHWTMYTPVVGAPLAALVLAWFAFFPSATLRLLLTWVLWIEAFAGLGGFGMHARGIRQRLGGFVMNNVLTGPPIVLPLTLSAFSLLGLMALYWRL
ncbi:MAG TPA: hypothetical protein VD973_28475 [Symbiobacteriaceae bacterium]|nr:hypothetical protein [Symbiobacteriaceae bacterium]